MRILTLSLTVLLIFIARPSLNAKKVLTKQRSAVNLQAVIDSAVLMVDDYSTAITEKPELSKFRLNRIRDFYNRQPNVAQDSVRSILYSLMVGYIDNDNLERAKIFQNCYLALAGPDDSRLGNIYAASIAMAREEDDTTEINRFLPLLKEYAARTNYDFDEEISGAKDYIAYMQNRRPINLELMGVWVSEKICNAELVLPGLFRFEDDKSDFYRVSNPYILGITEDKIICINNRTAWQYPSDYYELKYKDLPRFGYEVPAEIVALGKYLKKKSVYFEVLPHSSYDFDKKCFYEAYPKEMLYDERSRSAYSVWSNEKINSFDADFSAQIRQSLQYGTARMIGNTARKNASTGKRIKRRITASAINSFGNSILDRMAVSSATFWLREITVQLNSPDILTAWIFTQYNNTKTNTGHTQTLDNELNDIKYYRWKPDDDVYFQIFGQFIILGNFDELPKFQKEAIKNHYKGQKKIYESRFGKLRSPKDYDEFNHWFNTMMLNKLKEKAELKR